MNIFQGKKLNTIIEKIASLELINKYMQTPSENPEQEKLKEQLNEILNYIKLKEYLMDKGYYSFHIKIAPNTYYTWSLLERSKFLQTPSEDYLCKTIVMKNKKYLPEFKSPYYHQYLCVIVQYNTSLKNEKLIKVMREYNRKNCTEQVPRRGFHYRLASEEENDQLTGYRHNSVTPFMLNENMPIIVSERLKSLPGRYFWLGGGHENTKLKEFETKSEYTVIYGDIVP